jgi:hypothetical protein
MIGRWMPLLKDVAFSENEMGGGRQVVVGRFQKEGCMVLNPSTVLWVVMMVSVSLGRVFGGLGFC